MAEKLIKNIQAPYKEMIWFEQSDHGLLEEEAEGLIAFWWKIIRV